MSSVKLALAAFVLLVATTVALPTVSRAGIGDAIPGLGVVTMVTSITGVGNYYTVFNPVSGLSSVIGPF
jgi:hypothetical protein